MYIRKRLVFVDFNSIVIFSVISMILIDVVVDLINISFFGNNIKRQYQCDLFRLKFGIDYY